MARTIVFLHGADWQEVAEQIASWLDELGLGPERPV